MGNLQTKKSLILEQEQHQSQWKSQYFQNDIEIVLEYRKNIRGQRYIINVHDYSYQQKIFNFRNKNSLYFVSILDVQIVQQSSFCSNSSRVMVITQKIQKRFCQLKNINFSQAIQILNTTLFGAKLIFGEIGGVNYNETMICFNQKNHVKIWCNSKFYNNHPAISAQVSEKETIESLFNTVQGKIEQIPLIYDKLKSQIKDWTFENSFNFLSQVKKQLVEKQLVQKKIETISYKSSHYHNELVQQIPHEKNFSFKTNSNKIEKTKQIPISTKQIQIYEKNDKQKYDQRNKYAPRPLIINQIILRQNYQPSISFPLQKIDNNYIKNLYQNNLNNFSKASNLQQKPIMQNQTYFENLPERVSKILNQTLLSEKIKEEINNNQKLSITDHSDFQKFQISEQLNYNQLRQKILFLYS